MQLSLGEERGVFTVMKMAGGLCSRLSGREVDRGSSTGHKVPLSTASVSQQTRLVQQLLVWYSGATRTVHHPLSIQDRRPTSLARWQLQLGMGSDDLVKHCWGGIGVFQPKIQQGQTQTSDAKQPLP